ncbi:MAG TPA: flagellar export protein FliJ [Chthonomonadaceae bacterium]|nr:flagellar export protein FliJ [Chthonomonadaceae bacterium]
MRRFQFRLETVLRHRELIVELREQSYTTAQGHVLAAEAKLSELQAQYREVVAGRPGGTPGVQFDASEIQGRERYLETLQAAMERHQRRRDAARIVAEQMHAALIAARQAREAVARLHTKALQTHQALIRQIEQNALDELALLRHKPTT